MEFTLDSATDDLRRRVRTFVDERLIPLEADRASYDEHENIREDLLGRMRGEARAAGLWALQTPKARGGGGLPFVGMAACYEEMNRSIFGPACFNCAAPDDGNMRVLNQLLATDALKDKWLQPIIDGKLRGAIAMTEPHPGGGSDPTMIRTIATREGDKWIINGRKWFITGAGWASHFILLARTSDEPRKELTAFMVHRDMPGFRVVRRIPIMGPEEHGGHCEIEIENVEVPDENRVLDVGQGMRVIQARLVPARLTHCMRWLGLAKRAMAIANDYIDVRQAFGTKLADKETVQQMIGDVAKDIEIGRLLVMKAAWALDQGEKAMKETSMAKIFVANMLHKAVDTAIQLNGARGYSKDTILEWIYRYARQARILDGADEVHKMILARSYRKEGQEFWGWGA